MGVGGAPLFMRTACHVYWRLLAAKAAAVMVTGGVEAAALVSRHSRAACR